MKQLTLSLFAWCCHLLILAGTLASQGAESPDNVPLATELSNGGRLEVVYAIIGTNALSGEELRLLAVADSKGVAVHFPSELRASLACTNGIRAPYLDKPQRNAQSKPESPLFENPHRLRRRHDKWSCMGLLQRTRGNLDRTHSSGAFHGAATAPISGRFRERSAADGCLDKRGV